MKTNLILNSVLTLTHSTHVASSSKHPSAFPYVSSMSHISSIKSLIRLNISTQSLQPSVYVSCVLPHSIVDRSIRNRLPPRTGCCTHHSTTTSLPVCRVQPSGKCFIKQASSSLPVYFQHVTHIFNKIAHPLKYINTVTATISLCNMYSTSQYSRLFHTKQTVTTHRLFYTTSLPVCRMQPSRKC